MITREEAAALLNNALVGNPEPWSPSEWDVWDANAAPVVGIQSARLSAAAPDLARTVVALYGERAEHMRLIDEARNELAAARLELRRLRAAEAPGTDDAAFEGTGWGRRPELPGWTHADGVRVYARGTHPTMFDAMRAAVPGSV